jgi:hypothetical protein
MQISLAAEALAHVRAAKDVLRKHPLEAAGRHWYRALGALAEAEQELQEGQELVLGRLEGGAGRRVPEGAAGTNAGLPSQES